jgi:hypothetical protein
MRQCSCTHCCCCCCCRCAQLQGLDDTALKACLKAASYKLLYPGTEPAGGADGTQAGDSSSSGAAAAQQLKDSKQAGDSSSKAGGSGSQAHDLVSLHSKFNRGKVENMLSSAGVTEDSWTFAEQVLAVCAVTVVVVLVYSRIRKHSTKAKDHRSE